MTSSELLDTLQEPWAIILIAFVGALLVAITLSQLAARRRRRDLLQALETSTRGTVQPFPVKQWGTIACTLSPPPEPFSQFFVYFTMRPRPWPLGIVSRLFGGRSQRIELRGVLRQRPTTELIWQRGMPAARAAGRGAETELWKLRRLPVAPGEYAVRGANAQGVEHLFVDAMARYGAFAQKVTLQIERAPHVQIVLAANGLNAEDVAALVSMVAGLGRAATRS